MKHSLTLDPISIRSILADSKTQHRFVGAAQNPTWHGLGITYIPRQDLGMDAVATYLEYGLASASVGMCVFPYGVPGDRLLIKEAFWIDRRDSTLVVMDSDGSIVAKNGNETGEIINVFDLKQNGFWSLNSPEDLPDWAVRLTLAITSIRIERVSAITVEDAISEGIGKVHDNSPFGNTHGWVDYQNKDALPFDNNKHIASYRSLWDSTHSHSPWDANPWVWVVDFRRVEI